MRAQVTTTRGQYNSDATDVVYTSRPAIARVLAKEGARAASDRVRSTAGRIAGAGAGLT